MEKPKNQKQNPQTELGLKKRDSCSRFFRLQIRTNRASKVLHSFATHSSLFSSFLPKQYSSTRVRDQREHNETGLGSHDAAAEKVNNKKRRRRRSSRRRSRETGHRTRHSEAERGREKCSRQTLRHSFISPTSNPNSRAQKPPMQLLEGGT